MGAELIGVGFTVDPEKYNTDNWSIHIARTLFSGRLTETDRHMIDYSFENLEREAQYVDVLVEAVDFLSTPRESLRFATETKIGDTGLVYLWFGGTSWGEDPFDPYTALCVLLDVLDNHPELAVETPFVGCGIVTERPTS
jgi:hypothetical protein